VDNLINVFMNYKVNRLTSYGVLIFHENSFFIKQVFKAYFKTYVDNYYYGVFNTISEKIYSEENLKLEFQGVMEEMLDDYMVYELQVSNEEYSANRSIIVELKDIALEVVKLDSLEYADKDEIAPKVQEFVNNNLVLNRLLGERVPRLITLIRETFLMNQKMLNYEDKYFEIEESKFENNQDISFLTLKNQIKALNIYRKAMVDKVYNDNRLDEKKIECLIQKVSLNILKSILEKKEIKPVILEVTDSIIRRGKISNDIMALIDNPLFRKYVVLAVEYNTYVTHKGVFFEDYTLACIQDYSHINDIYQKTENIFNEAMFSYLIVSDYKYRDRDFFLDYQNEALKVLLFEED